jgi:hypothetical protein
VKQANHSEIMKMNKAISILEAKITAGVADSYMTTIQQSTVTRTAAVGQMDSTDGTLSSDASGLDANACSMSAGNGSANIRNTSM